jgi:putative addiction module killer protein
MYTIHQTEVFQNWLDALTDQQAQVRIAMRLRLAESGNLGDWKAVGFGVFEMRINVGAGYRVYFARRGKILILILAGGNKSTQAKDIKRAQQSLKLLELNDDEETC